MNVHEYQAKELMASFGVPVPKGGLADTPEQAVEIAKQLGSDVCVVKAQIHAGGRGKGGGVKVCKSLDEVKAAAEAILGMHLVTHQTGPEGKLVHKVWIEEGTDIARELYAAVVLDRGAERMAVMASPSGGMDIEQVAEQTPELIFSTRLEPGQPIWDFQCRQLLFGCGLDAGQVRQGTAMIQALVKMAMAKDATLVEINPLAVTGEGKLIALDGKINFDDSALRRNPDIAALKDPTETDELELTATGLGLNYIRLDGNVGTMVNGAGLAMATMDVVNQAGAKPANFLDVGGGANEEMITKGFEIILDDPNVEAILINIFGGILRCDVLAAGVVGAAQKIDLQVPLVVRLEGTNVEEGKRILGESSIQFEVAGSMSEAAAKVAAVLGGAA
ncbi:MAG: ADP-forming succinate--CoA ligase subunit beta [Desulfarculaceae bacterium]|nr:ADP-forming succinate--CoA ligase subunit beta [Desulfarculaceae bacterium]MCF8074509.1 ADP-forming succinate--CoA ligase subunit beta [Desulfarculaceae bacterium]MCF8103579.1 ADP-forming succinate--CoA ligase subunit beta [Desulfarculaceae bacterium]MCF8118369.1 ADP-forming succinate--CoA ligase subunit beta [Desulfarculaceae bacterium]